MSTHELDEKALRKAWLKQYFGSFEYHEQMLWYLHQWLQALRKALVRAKADHGAAKPGCGFKTIAEGAEFFEKRYMAILEKSDTFGRRKPENWPNERRSASFRSVPDFDRYLISEGDMLTWLNENERNEIGPLWGKMSQMAENIQYTVDGNWDAHGDSPYWILEEKYTGPITYPPDWKEQILGLGAHLPTIGAQRIRAGDSVPQSGLWRALDVTSRELRVQAGETLPDLSSAYGITIWQLVGD